MAKSKQNNGSAPTPIPQGASNESVQGVLQGIPHIGRLLALIARHVGLSAAVAVTFFLFIAPLIYPVLFALYMSMFPAGLKTAYAKYVLDAFGVDDLISADVDEAVRKFVADNNARIDFVQQFQQVWEPDVGQMTYSLPLELGQEFKIGFQPIVSPAEKRCDEKSPAANKAQVALRSRNLFSVEVLGKSRFTTPAKLPQPYEWSFGESLWSTADAEIDQVRRQRTMTLTVVIDQGLASDIWKCWRIKSDLSVTVNKSMKQIKVGKTPTSASSAPKQTKP